MDVYERVAGRARKQYGLITREQAYELGMTPAQVAHEVATRRWVRVASGVYRINGTPLTWKGRMMAACLAAGPGAVISHRSAAALWNLEGFEPPRVLDVSVGNGRRPRVEGVRVRRRRYVRRTFRDGIPVTPIPDTILDLSEGKEAIALRALDDVDRRKLATWTELWECLVLHAGRGRRGVAAYRRLLEYRNGRTPPGGTFAGLVRKLLVDAGLPEPVCEFPVVSGGRPYFLDLAYVDVKIDVECDGREGHLNARSFENDRIRNNNLALDGWLVLHVTWERLKDKPGAVAAEVREALRQRYADQSSGLSSVY
jgi:hypothetical protein